MLHIAVACVASLVAGTRCGRRLIGRMGTRGRGPRCIIRIGQVHDLLVGQVAEQLGEPDGIIAFDPSSFPKRGTHSVGVKRQWCSHRGKVDRSIYKSL